MDRTWQGKFNESISVMCLEQCHAFRMCSINIIYYFRFQIMYMELWDSMGVLLLLFLWRESYSIYEAQKHTEHIETDLQCICGITVSWGRRGSD